MSRWFYELSLHLYPRELRARFGAEMSEIFAAQLEAVHTRHSSAAILRVWWEAYSELLSVALPCQIVNPAFAVRVASVLSTGVIYLSLSWVLENPLRLNSIYHSMVGSFSK